MNGKKAKRLRRLVNDANVERHRQLAINEGLKVEGKQPEFINIPKNPFHYRATKKLHLKLHIKG